MSLQFNRAAFVALAVIAAFSVACSGVGSGPGMSGGAGSPSVAVASPIALPDGFPIGTWTTTITADDLRAGGFTGSAELAENAGVFTMTLAEDGSWSVSQEADVPLRWPVFRGTYAVTGATSFEQTTTFPPDFAGDVVGFEWAVEDGDLVVEVPDPPDPIMPIIMESHPWKSAG